METINVPHHDCIERLRGFSHLWVKTFLVHILSSDSVHNSPQPSDMSKLVGLREWPCSLTKIHYEGFHWIDRVGGCHWIDRVYDWQQCCIRSMCRCDFLPYDSLFVYRAQVFMSQKLWTQLCELCLVDCIVLWDLISNKNRKFYS